MHYKPFCLLVFIFLSISTFAQDKLVISYDALGNRISRAFVGDQSASRHLNNNLENSKKSENQDIETDTDFIFNFSPNPADQVLNVNLKGVKNATLILSNMQGSITIKSTITEGNNAINVEQLPIGTYVILLKSDKIVKSDKLIIK